MKKTVLITGASSGIGKSAAQYFAKNGWNVAATMRNPEKEKELSKIDGIKLFALDVTDINSIQTAINSVISTFKGIDVIVNNAGFGGVGVFEAAKPEQIQKQFDVNLFGAMNVIREILPHFRKKREGTIINVTSVGGIITFPIYSVYHSTKWALEGFSEALQFELAPFNIKVKNVEPGAIKTDFYDRSQDLFKKAGLNDYDKYQQIAFDNSQKAGYTAPGPQVVAKKIFQAATDGKKKMRYPVGSQAPLLIAIRRLIPLNLFMNIVRSVVEKGFK